jgi:5-methyltetrahydropteroyltriglutamate--homocysteine methyltransferase
VPMDQLGLSPLCGFKSNEEGNLLTEDQQRRKLDLVVEPARKMWADA